MTRFLVTGAKGFIGSAVVRRLVNDGLDAVPYEGDLLAPVLPELSSVGATHCIHAAWYTHHSDYLTHGINRAWVDASLRLLDGFLSAGGKRFVGIGTCLEYDVEHSVGPCSEASTPLHPETLYARCKLDLFEALKQRDGNSAWARVFFVYGPGDRQGRLVPQMIDHYARGEIAEPKFGSLRRDYIHVDDLADQLIRIALSDVGDAINTGTGLAPSLSEMFAAGAEAFGHPKLARSNVKTGGQPLEIRADLDRFRREVGNPAARDFATGIRDLIE